MNYVCLLLLFVASSAFAAVSRNYIDINNATTNTVIYQFWTGSGWNSMACPQQSSVHVTGLASGITGLNIGLIDSKSGVTVGAYFFTSIWPNNSETVSWFPNGQAAIRVEV